MRILFTLLSLSVIFSVSAQNIGLSYIKINELTVDSFLVKTKSNATPAPASILDRKKSVICEEIELESYDRLESINIFKKSKFIEGYRMFSVEEFKLEDLSFSSARFLFYHDTLIEFTTGPPDPKLPEILQFKYGKPELQTRRDTVDCASYDGKPTENIRISQHWDVKRTTAVLYMSIDYNYKCERDITSYFAIYDIDQKYEYNELVSAKKKALTEKGMKKY